MALTLLDAATTPTDGTAQDMTAPGTVYIRGLEGGVVVVEVSPDEGDDAWAPVLPKYTDLSHFVIDAVGPYRLRARLLEATASTSCTVIVEQDA